VGDRNHCPISPFNSGIKVFCRAEQGSSIGDFKIARMTRMAAATNRPASPNPRLRVVATYRQSSMRTETGGSRDSKTVTRPRFRARACRHSSSSLSGRERAPSS
jgi:hypothetical protein